MRYRNKKTGEIYIVTGMAEDCTNGRDGTRVILYGREKLLKRQILPDRLNPDRGVILYEREKLLKRCFVREEREFFEKFEPVKANDNRKNQNGRYCQSRCQSAQ